MPYPRNPFHIARSTVGKVPGKDFISPGKLPNNLTVEKIKRGVSIKRNHTLASFAFDLISYRGIGSGIIRVLQHYPDIEFIDDVEIELFKAIIK